MTGWFRRRRDPDAEPTGTLSPEQRQRAHEHALVKLRAAKASYIAGRCSFEQLWELWWRAEISSRPMNPLKWSVKQIAVEAMELEKERLTPATGGIVPSGRTIPLERRGCDYVIPKAEVERLGSIATLPEAMKPNLPTPRTGTRSSIEVAVRGLTVDMYDGR